MEKILNNKERKELHIQRKTDGCCVGCGIKLSGYIPKDEDFFPLCPDCAEVVAKEVENENNLQ